jgi:anaerobic magnesium-protoporphyrin IX monomethyl ester cyclase
MLTPEQLKCIRHGLNLSQEAFANALLIRPVLVRQWENGRKPIGGQFVGLIERHFGESVETLLESGEQQPNTLIVNNDILDKSESVHKDLVGQKKVLLVFPEPSSRNNYINSLPPLGILSIAGYLRDKGIVVDVVDCQIEKNRDWLKRVDDYDIIGFSINTAIVETAMYYIDQIKSCGCRAEIILGGPHALAAPEVFINHPHIDAVFVGEGERSLYEYLTAPNPRTVPGIYLKDSSNERGFCFTGARPWDQSLDELGFPALDLVDVSKYRYYPKATLPISSIMTSRGCPQQCIFCFHNMGTKFRVRSAKQVVDEIDWQVNDLGVKELSIYDDNFSLDRQRAMDIAQGIIDRGIKVRIQFTNGLEACRLDRELIFKLKEAGTWFMGVAPETGDQESLKKIKKGFQLQKAKEVVGWCNEAGIKTYAFFIVGFPWETEEHIQNTLAFSKELDTHMVQFSRLLAFPKTEVYEQLLETGMKAFDPMKDRAIFTGEIGHKVSDLSQEKLELYLKKAYRGFYLRPKKMIGLFQMMSPRDVYELARYALVTGNVF